MTRTQYDAAQAEIPGTWQNHQGRGLEPAVAPAAKAVFFFAVVAVSATGCCALIALGVA